MSLTLSQETAAAASIALTTGAAGDTSLADVISMGSGADAMEQLGVNAYAYDQYGRLMTSPVFSWNLKGLGSESSGMKKLSLTNGADASKKVISAVSGSGYKTYELSMSSGSLSKTLTIVQPETLGKVTNVTWSANTVTWTAVSGASGYAVELMKMNGTTSTS